MAGGPISSQDQEKVRTFLAPLYESTGSCCCHSDVGISVGLVR